MSVSYNIIGDVAGQYDCLVRLLTKMPGGTPISVGDMVDRGPKSKEVLDLFMQNGRAVLGNHEHQLVDAYRSGGYYDKYLWTGHNGGLETLKSFFPEENIGQFGYTEIDHFTNFIPAKYIFWLESLPLYIKEKNLFISHAAKHPQKWLKTVTDLGIGFARRHTVPKKDRSLMGESIIWNPGKPGRMNNHFQIYGHMANKYPVWYSDDRGRFAVDIDTSFARVLTGIHWPSKIIFQEPYDQGVDHESSVYTE